MRGLLKQLLDQVEQSARVLERRDPAASRALRASARAAVAIDAALAPRRKPLPIPAGAPPAPATPEPPTREGDTEILDAHGRVIGRVPA